MRKRTTIDWEERDAPLVVDLGRFQARARGKRLKDLAMLGLIAEANGIRLDPARSGLAGVGGLTSSLQAVATQTDAANDAEPGAAKAPAMSSKQQGGVDRLLGNFDF